MTRLLQKTVLAFTVAMLAAIPAQAGDSSRTTEIYHIFNLQTDARRADVIRALQDGLNLNISDSNTTTPIVMGPPPATPGRFELVSLASNPNFPFGALVPAAQMAMLKQVKCDGAVWISSAVRRVSGSQQLMLTLCLFPYASGYALDIYAIDSQERGGGLSERLGRALGRAIVGNPAEWTNKTIVDALRSVRRRLGATITYVEGQPEFTGTPWTEDTQIAPTRADKTTIDTAPAPQR